MTFVIPCNIYSYNAILLTINAWWYYFNYFVITLTLSFLNSNTYLYIYWILILYSISLTRTYRFWTGRGQPMISFSVLKRYCVFFFSVNTFWESIKTLKSFLQHHYKLGIEHRLCFIQYVRFYDGNFSNLCLRKSMPTLLKQETVSKKILTIIFGLVN